MTPAFDDWYREECAIDAAELVGPNSPQLSGSSKTRLGARPRGAVSAGSTRRLAFPETV